MIKFLIKLHAALKAYFIFRYRQQEVLRVYRVLHAQELADAAPQEWPLLQASHAVQIDQIRRGKLVTGNPIYAQENGKQITDRRSWQWPFLPASVTRMAVPLAKMSPYNLRRISRTPVPRRAINLVKGAVISQPWDIVVLEEAEQLQDSDYRKSIIKQLLAHPNNDDSFQTWIEQSLEDFCCFGAFATEMRVTTDPERPIKMWPVNVESIRIFSAWSESTAQTMPRYAQMTGLKGERGAILFYDDQLLYIRDNPATDNPFGLGRVEVAYQSLNFLLGIQEMSGRAGSDQVHKTWLWWEQPQTDAAYQIVRRHIQNEMEGQAKVSIIGGMKKPEVIEIQPVEEGDLLIPWQEMLIRMVANAFDLSAMSLGVEHDVNRAVGTVLSDRDFRSAIVPLAKRLQDAITRKIIHEKLGWYDLSFKFLSLDDPDIETKIDMYQRSYAMNATTPNQYRIAMGWKPLNNPFCDLTQFEAMLVNMQASAEIQTQQQIKMMKFEQQMQQEMAQQQQGSGFPPDSGPSGPDGPPMGSTPPALPPGGGNQPRQIGAPQSPDALGAPKGGGTGSSTGPAKPKTIAQPTAPKALKLPKFPVAASRYTADDIAAMSLDELAAAFDNGELPDTASVVQDMDAQDPTVLDNLEDSVKQFLQQRLLEEEKELGPYKASAKWLRQFKQQQMQKKRDDQKRIQDMTKWLYQPGSKVGNVPGRMPLKGKPGNVNPIDK